MMKNVKRGGKIVVAIVLLVATVLCCCACGPKGTGRKVPVTFKLNNGFGEAVVQMDEGIPMKNAPTPTMRGAKFIGWANGRTMWDIENDNVTEGLVLSARWALVEDALEPDPNAGVLSEGTDLRVCSFNLLKEGAFNATPVRNRVQGLLDMLVNYKMDIVSCQECCSTWRGYISGRIKSQGLSYKQVSVSNKGETSAYLDIIYNTERLTLLDCGVVKYTTPNDYDGDLMWAKFETKDAQKRQFIALSFAWCYNQPDTRLEQCQIVSDWVNEKKADTGLPVISMGDYNDYESSDPCKNYLANTAMKDAKLEAPRKGLVGKSYHTTPQMDTYTNGELNQMETIDHIYYTGEFSALYYDVIISNNVLVVSDHNPVYADLKFN